MYNTNEYECAVQIRTNVEYKWEQIYSTNVQWTVFRGTKWEGVL